MATCAAANQTFEFRQDPVVFHNTQLINNVHSHTPRWGMTRDVNTLYQGTTEQSQDYAWGVAANAMAIFVLILLWFMLILSCKCAGPSRVGLLSGRLQQRRQAKLVAAKAEDEDSFQLKPEDFEPNYEEASYQDQRVSEDNAALKEQERRLRPARIAVLICSLGIAVSVVIMLTIGVADLEKASNNAVDGIVKAESLTSQALVLIDDFIARQTEAYNAANALVQQVNTFCPLVRAQLCTNLTTEIPTSATGAIPANLTTEIPTCDFTGIPYAAELEPLITSYRQMVLEQVNNVRADVVQFGLVLEDVHNKSDNFNWAFIVASVFAGLLFVLNLFVAYGVFVAWRKTSNTNCLRKVLTLLRHWLLLPIFVFLVIISWIFSMVFVLGSITSSDFCVNSPDDRMVMLLEKKGDFLDSVVLKLLLYYIKGCPVEDNPQQLVDQVNKVIGVFNNVVAVVDQLANAATDGFQQICGTDPATVQAAATTLEGTICNLGKTIVDVQLYFSCENWRPLYRTVMYDGVCYNGNEGFYYVTITQLCIVIFAMTMVTLRVAFYEVEEEKSRGEVAEDRAEARGFTSDDDTTGPGY